jgi:PHS family inorganic phosphate transporter-like MFS transporter
MMLGYLYGSSTDPACQTTKCLSYGQDLALKVATSVGTLVGHLFFGWAADIVGRKHMCT